MTVRVVEGKKPYTGGKAIEVTDDKVINLRLRDENNLIIYDAGDDEIYVDLQLPDEIQPIDAFPVGITTGRVIVDNGWDEAGTIICAKTTSGDNIKLLYADSGNLYIDNGTGTFKQIYLKADIDAFLLAMREYVDEKPTFKPFLDTFDTTHTTQDFLDSVQNSDIQEGDVYLGRLTVSDLPSSMIQAEVEVYVYPENGGDYVIFCVLRSATTSPYIWQCSSYQYDGWHTIGGGGGGSQNSKIFELATDQDLTTAQEAYEWYLAGKYPIIKVTPAQVLCPVQMGLPGELYFVGAWYGYSTSIAGGDSDYYAQGYKFTITNGTVTAVSDYRYHPGISFLATNVNYFPTYTPQYDGSPATKKYVDDKVDDTAYASSWDGKTTVAPSQNAVYDKFETLGTASTCNTGTSSGNVPVLDSNGKLNKSTLPGVALTDTFTVSTSSDLTSLSSAEQGDLAIVTTENKTYVLASEPYSTAANWKEILSPTGGVTSVNGQTGAVTVSEFTPGGTATTGYVVKKTASGYEWAAESGAVTSVNGNTGAVTVSEFSPSGTATTGYVVTKTAGGYEWAAPSGGDVVVSSQSGNILTSGMKIWAGEETDYANLGTYDNNTLYLTVPDSN